MKRWLNETISWSLVRAGDHGATSSIFTQLKCLLLVASIILAVIFGIWAAWLTRQQLTPKV
jgi:hypothetical protein